MTDSKIKIVITILLVIMTLPAISQETKKLLSLDIDNLNKKQVIELLEKNTDYKFYFLDKWFDNKKKTIAFKNVNIETVLKNLFKGSDINYFILDKKIILTNGNLIRESVYETNKNNTLNNNSPVLVDSEIETYTTLIKIGKEEKQKKATYLLSGFILNDKNGEPIEGATIVEKNNKIYTTSNQKGYYTIELPFGKNLIETSFVGFESLEKDFILYNNGKLNFLITPKLEELDEIVINANKGRNIRQTIAGINQIKVQEIKTIPLVLGERDILKVAATLPSIKSTGEGSEGVNVRGGKVDQNLFLLDNGVIYNPTHFLGLFSAINPFTTDGLKIYTGNIPAEYGGRLSSVFDLSTKDPSNEQFKGEASVGPVTGSINLEVPIIKNKSGLNLGLRSTYSDWVLDLVDNKDFKKSSVSFHDVIAKYTHLVNENNTLKLTGYYSKDKYQIASDTINSYGNTMFSLNWEHKFNDKNRGHLILSNSSYGFNMDYKPENTNNGFDLKYKINEANFKLKMKYIHSKNHKFDYGFESKLYNINPGEISPNSDNSQVNPLTINKEKAIENSLFISDEVTINPKLNLNLGIRFNQYLALGPSTQREYKDNNPKNESTLKKTTEYGNNKIFKTYNGLSYRLAGRYELNKTLALKAGFNKSFQYIHRLNNNTTATPIDTWRLSDINIKPQEGTQISLGLFKNLNGNKYEVSLESYYKKYKNLLDYKVGATLLLNDKIETQVIQGKGKSYGVEFLLKKKEGNLNGWLSYSYSRSLIQLNSMFDEERVNNGNFFPTNYDKPHDVNLVLNYKFTKRYSLSSNFTYQSGRPITYPTGKYTYQGAEYLTYSNRNQFRIPDYFRLDIGLNIEGNHRIKKFAHSFWNISVYNVLGRNNPYSVFFKTSDSGNIKAYQSSIFSRPIPTITYNFKF
ncbi:outer membrane receptor for ferrienterochelin and colicin [Tenacibaculum lutimaris]|uniref:Outer membrane receptor for ferrienterochelin and colicin n=1 Tax=Tenacibaculum lutimaris TaxID=285258 RepID=A0A420E0J1_9FLAO|nr:TonB-dependent receptor [Tenacibaculum lutimaris]RKF03558.1 outer membrane receptor for ferrienterochelin and colicin [Tenacibaculum lutimaris]